MTQAASAPKTAPTYTRYVVVLSAMLLSWVTFLDRAAIAQAAPLITRDLNLTSVQMGYVFSAFGLAYAICELPGGLLCDLKGPRKALTRIVVWWSVFTIGTGWAWNLTSLWITRLLFGAGEADCYPSLARMFRTWLPVSERPLAEGLKAASSRLGAAMAPFMVVTLLGFMSWRGVFFVFGCLGFVWAAGFWVWFRDRPSKHSGVNRAELLLIPAGEEAGSHASPPWRRTLTSPSFWMLALQWFCHFYAFYFYITWLPTYLQSERGVPVARSAVLAGLPILTAAMGSLVGGWLLGRAIRYLQDVRRARQMVAFVSYSAAAILMLLAIQPASAEWAVALMGLSSFSAEFSGPLTWTTAMDLGGRHVGTVSGAMNSIGQMGGAVAPTLVGYFARAGGAGWNAALYSAAFVYGIAFLCWIFLDSVTPLDQPPEPATADIS